jgi:exonuclease SbcD
MPKYIHTADIHLRLSVPICRTETEEEWLNTQRASLETMRDYAIEHDAYLILDGDIFDSPVASVRLVNMFLDTFLPIKDKVLLLAGNHDLPGHNFNMVDSCSYGIIRKNFQEIPDMEGELGGFHFNAEYNGEHKILVTHQLVFDNEKDQSIVGSGKMAKDLLEEFPHAEIILTGDMHDRFVHVSKDGRIVANPGCVTRQSIKYANHKPSVFLIDTDDKKVDILYLPDTNDVISTEHKDRIEEREERIGAFLEVVKTTGMVSLDFLKNLEEKVPSLDDEIKDVLNDVINIVKKEME